MRTTESVTYVKTQPVDWFGSVPALPIYGGPLDGHPPRRTEMHEVINGDIILWMNDWNRLATDEYAVRCELYELAIRYTHGVCQGICLHWVPIP